MNKLFQPVQVGSLTLKNSIVFAPTSVGREGLELLMRRLPKAALH